MRHLVFASVLAILFIQPAFAQVGRFAQCSPNRTPYASNQANQCVFEAEANHVNFPVPNAGYAERLQFLSCVTRCAQRAGVYDPEEGTALTNQPNRVCKCNQACFQSQGLNVTTKCTFTEKATGAKECAKLKAAVANGAIVLGCVVTGEGTGHAVSVNGVECPSTGSSDSSSYNLRIRDSTKPASESPMVVGGDGTVYTGDSTDPLDRKKSCGMFVKEIVPATAQIGKLPGDF